jgi:hypothetical protein
MHALGHWFQSLLKCRQYAVLNEFALPRAIVDFERHSFLAWNPGFLEHTGFSEDEMKTSKSEELLTFGESWFPLSGGRLMEQLLWLDQEMWRVFTESFWIRLFPV